MPKTIIFANGKGTGLDQIARIIKPEDRIICANGGTLHCLEMGLMPQMIVGDLDSLPAHLIDELTQKGVTLQKHPAKKDKTDFELALDIACRGDWQNVTVLTALGGRLDQLLANILLMKRFAQPGRTLALEDKNIFAQMICGPDKIVLKGRPGDGLSLLPLSEHVHHVSLYGTEWELSERDLEFGSTLTISNTWKKSELLLSLSHGILLLLHRYESIETE